MTRRRWIADEVSGDRAILTGPHADHLARVLRARVGQEFDVVANGTLRRGRISAIAENKVEFELGEEIDAGSVVPVTVALSIFKFDRMEWVIEKCTELGVAKIVPVIAQRTESHLAAAALKRVERWQRIVQQAAEQSRRISPPEVSPPMKLKEALALAGSMRIVLSETEQERTLRDAVSSSSHASDLSPASSYAIVLAFGPEGGWTEAEVELFQQGGWVSASLGKTILRAETAAIAAVAVVMTELQ